jgi:membrane protease subunit HflC
MRHPFRPLVLMAAVLFASAYSAFFMVDQTQLAFVIQMGESVGKPLEPGLHIKIPFIQRVVRLDKRLLDYTPGEFTLLSADQQTLLVSCYVKWRIADPSGFYQRVGDNPAALRRLDDIIGAELRAAFGKQRLGAILSSGKSTAIDELTRRSHSAVQAYGIDLVDLQIRNIRLTSANLDAVWARMRAEFAASSQRHLSAGHEKKLQMMAQADRQQAGILAEAQRLAQTLRGQAEAEATRIYAEAYVQDPEFFNFTRSLEVSRKALNEKTILMLSPEYEFLRFLKQSGVNPVSRPTAASPRP